MRAFLRGLIAGSMLSCLRAALGVDLFEWGAVGARTSYGWRAAALAAVALGLWTTRQASLPARFLLGTFVGYGIHGLFLANVWAPEGNIALACSACAGLLLLAAVRPNPGAGDAEDDPPRFLEMLGLAAAAAGATIALEGIARHVRLFEGGLSQDDSISALACLATLTLGAAAFGWLAGSKAWRGLALPIALAACACACLVSLSVVSQLSVPSALGSYLKRFGLDTSLHGTLGFDALISGAAFVAPGLLLGAGLPAARGRSRLFGALLGSAVGLCLVPALLRLNPGASPADAQPSSAELVPLGSLVASVGALIAILSLSDRGALARWSGIAVSLALALPGLLRQVEPLHVLSPWAFRSVFPVFVSDTPEGLVTVESFGILGGSWTFVTLDRHQVTPDFESAVADALRLRASLDLMPSERRARGKVQVLLVGQLSPERARILTDAGVGRVDRCAAWWDSMPRIEEALWNALPERHEKPEGDILPPGEARARVGRGDYDLVIAPPVPGDAPRFGRVLAPARTTVVRWLDLDEPAEQRDFEDRVALMIDGLERPALALVENGVVDFAAEASQDPYAPLLLRPGSPRRAPWPLAWLRTRCSERVNERAHVARAAMMTRLAAAERGGPLEDLMAGFELFFAAQIPSSQFESPVDRVELPDACLDRFRAAALARTPDPTVRRTWETLAQVLAGKRWIEKIYAYVKPVAEKHPPWPALEKALAKADLESLEPQDALRRLDSLKETAPEDFEVWFLLGQAQCVAGDGSQALESWRRAVWLKTSDRVSRRKIALALARSGDAEGREAARQLLLEAPNDEELKSLLAQPNTPGPPSDPCSR